jgi:hypothetical protein
MVDNISLSSIFNGPGRESSDSLSSGHSAFILP